MAITAIKDFKIKEAYSKLIEKALFSYIWEGIYKPMFEIMDIKPVIVKNSLNVIVEALRDGKIIYADGGFRAMDRFTNAQSLQLQKWGAVWDRQTKMYRLPESKLPNELRVTVAEMRVNAENQIKLLQGYIQQVELNMPYIVEGMVFDSEVKTILDDAGNEVKKNIKHLNIIEPELSEEQKNEIARSYTENVRGYVIKDFAEERIPEMRKKIQELVLQGYRQDKVEELLEKEYGIMGRKVKFLAQNETSIMLAEYKKVTYKGMGFDKFIWRTITDVRERELHKALNGTVWSYDNPPVIDERTGQKGLPGQAYYCSCEQIPCHDDSIFGHDINSKKVYKKILAQNSSDDIEWITVKGNHIPIKPGQTKERAVKEFVERKRNSQPKTIAGVKKGKPMSFKKANEGRVNPNYSKGKEYQRNCQSCIAVFEARLRGYDIEVLPRNNNTERIMNKLSHKPYLAYKDKYTGKHPEFIKATPKNAQECLNWLYDNIKQGERYAFGFSPKGQGNRGHIIEVIKNADYKIMFYDPQCAEHYNSKFLNYIDYNIYDGKKMVVFPIHIFRTDNTELDKKILDQIAKPAQ